MTTKTKEIRHRKKTTSRTPLTQAEIIRRINRSTRKSYRYFEMLIWNGGGYGK